jgi:hypothetical protein
MVEASRTAVMGDVAGIVELAQLLRVELAAMKGGELWLRSMARAVQSRTQPHRCRSTLVVGHHR